MIMALVATEVRFRGMGFDTGKTAFHRNGVDLGPKCIYALRVTYDNHKAILRECHTEGEKEEIFEWSLKKMKL